MVSFEDIQRREIAIFGTGLNAVKCAYYMLEKRKPIKCFLNNNKHHFTSFLIKKVSYRTF